MEESVAVVAASGRPGKNGHDLRFDTAEEHAFGKFLRRTMQPFFLVLVGLQAAPAAGCDRDGRQCKPKRRNFCRMRQRLVSRIALTCVKVPGRAYRTVRSGPFV
jgi:hypothetical protein